MADLDRLLDEAEARQLPALIADWAERDGYRWIARALRLDLALLVEHPELALPCIHRRCAWLGADDESRFFRELPPSPPDAGMLRARVQAWLERWSPGRRWLRSLRPQPIPLDTAVVEEYRTSVEGRLAFSVDGAVVGVLGGAASIAWERVTGRRIDDTSKLAAAPCYPEWDVDRDAGDGHLVMRCADEPRAIELAIDRHEHAMYARALSDTLVIVSARDGDDAPSYYLVDVAARAIVNRGDRWSDAACSPTGDHIYVGDTDGLTVFSTRTGRWALWRGPAVRQVVVAPNGTVATRSGPVIRIWEGAQTNAGAARYRMRSAQPALWSPDGERVITSGLLCDARSGRLVAELETFDPRGVIEGGPPTGYAQLCNGVYVEALPRWLRIWDTRSGELVVEDRTRGAFGLDAIAIDPQGRHFARYHGRRVEITTLREGDVVTSHTCAPKKPWPPELQFSADGAQLAWWFEHDGPRFVVAIAEPSIVRELAGDAPLPPAWRPREATVDGGLLVVDGAVLPFDEDAATMSPDGRSFAGAWSHVRLER